MKELSADNMFFQKPDDEIDVSIFRTDIDFYIDAVGGPSDNQAEACSIAQDDYDNALSNLEDYFAQNGGEISVIDNEPEETWEEGVSPDIKHFCRKSATVSGFISEDSTKSSIDSASFKSVTSPIRMEPLIIEKSRPALEQRYAKAWELRQWEIVGGEMIVDFKNAQRIGESVTEVRREMDNRGASTDFNWKVDFKEQIGESQTLRLTRTVGYSGKNKIGISYKGATAGGELSQTLSVQTMSTTQTTKTETIQDTFTTVVPAGKKRTVVFEVIRGTIRVPMTGYLIWDAIGTGFTWPPPRKGEAYNVSFFLNESERKVNLSGESLFGVFNQLRKRVIDE